jgi:dipeptidase E
MRLYLSSYRLGNSTELLQAMVGSNSRVAVIANALDASDASRRKELVQREFSDLSALGFEPTEIDLRAFFDGSFSTEVLAGYGLVWVRGGNAFNLRRAMAYSSFDNVIGSLLRKDAIIYGGYSAGVCVLSPDLHGIELCDNPNNVPEKYQPEVIWDGLSIVPYAVAPHYKSDHPESPMIDDVVKYFEQHEVEFKTLRDGEVIVQK